MRTCALTGAPTSCNSLLGRRSTSSTSCCISDQEPWLPGQFDYGAHAYVRALARAALCAARSRCRGCTRAHVVAHLPRMGVYVWRVRAVRRAPMCTGHFLYMQEERVPPGAVTGAQRQQQRAPESTSARDA